MFSRTQGMKHVAAGKVVRRVQTIGITDGDSALSKVISQAAVSFCDCLFLLALVKTLFRFEGNPNSVEINFDVNAFPAALLAFWRRVQPMFA